MIFFENYAVWKGKEVARREGGCFSRRDGEVSIRECMVLAEGVCPEGLIVLHPAIIRNWTGLVWEAVGLMQEMKEVIPTRLTHLEINTTWVMSMLLLSLRNKINKHFTFHSDLRPRFCSQHTIVCPLIEPGCRVLNDFFLSWKYARFPFVRSVVVGTMHSLRSLLPLSAIIRYPITLSSTKRNSSLV